MNPRLDRYGDEMPEDDTDLPHDEQCRNGWLGYDLDGALLPCLVCRPHLADYLRTHRRNER